MTGLHKLESMLPLWPCTAVIGESAVQERLASAQEAVQTELDVLKQGLQKRQQAAKVRALLKLMQDTAHVMSKVQHIPAV